MDLFEQLLSAFLAGGFGKAVAVCCRAELLDGGAAGLDDGGDVEDLGHVAEGRRLRAGEPDTSGAAGRRNAGLHEMAFLAVKITVVSMRGYLYQRTVVFSAPIVAFDSR